MDKISTALFTHRLYIYLLSLVILVITLFIDDGTVFPPVAILVLCVVVIWFIFENSLSFKIHQHKQLEVAEYIKAEVARYMKEDVTKEIESILKEEVSTQIEAILEEALSDLTQQPLPEQS